jgi:hypothetical protein
VNLAFGRQHFFADVTELVDVPLQRSLRVSLVRVQVQSLSSALATPIGTATGYGTIDPTNHSNSRLRRGFTKASSQTMDRSEPLDRANLTRLLLAASVLYVIGFYFIGAAVKPGYSQLSNFVSEYNATGTPWADTLTYAGFVATAALFSGFLVAAAPLVQVSGASRLGFWLLWSLPFSYLVGAIAPCDAGCPLDGSTSQRLHNAFSVLAYIGMGIGLALVSFAPGFSSFKLRRTFLLVSGTAFPAVFIAMIEPDLAPWRGLLQRSLDVAMAASLVLVVVTILTKSRRASQGAA